ncbi:ATP-binding protein [Pedobacter heparinus]|uniref:hybrid sensor histidine kinase/response regulator n=1 Tax=Pedobacter heparinus TaxID=984 RepID=UPI00292D84C1|nr:ATP-binding protein [Pedobacter heparinus]
MNESSPERSDELQNLAAHLQSLITSLEDIVFEIDGNHIFKNVWVSDERMLFMPKAAFLGKTIAEVMGPQAPTFTGPVNTAIQTGEVQEVVYPHLDPGITAWFKARIKPVVRAEQPENYILVLSIQDITTQKLADLALENAKEQLEMRNDLLDVSQKLSHTAGWELDIQTGAVFWTRQAYLLFEVEEDFAFSLENVQPFFASEDWRLLDACTEAAIKQGKPYDLELRFITGKGTHKWVRAIGIPVTKLGRVVMMRGALMDITPKKENEFALIDARNAAEKASKTKSDFLSVMSHEIRTPLNGIIGIANLLKLNHTMDQKEYIGNLIFSADHLMELINNILDLTKMENEKLELVLAEIDLLRLVKNIKNQFKSLAEAKGIELKSLIDDEVPQRIIADPIRISQMLNNLISNAIKFTDKGNVTLIIKLVSILANRASIHFAVRDTGMGIPPELQESVFESFKQVQQSPHREHGGTGLGLTITQKLAELHGSRVVLTSKAGKGSEFHFDLSFDIPENQSPDAPVTTSSVFAAHEHRLNGLKVLLVEDNQINVMVALKQLEYFGVNADCAYDGREALKLMEVNPYDVALIDLHMPGIDGYALAEIVRRKYPDIHPVIFTADIMNEVKQRFAQIHVYDILNKPFAPEKMFEVLLKVAQDRGIV